MKSDQVRKVLAMPLSGGWRPLAGVTALTLLSVLVMPAVLLAGYAYRVARATAAGETALPPLADPVGLAKDGGRVLAVHAPVVVPALLVLWLLPAPWWLLVVVGLVLAYPIGAVTAGYVATGEGAATYRSLGSIGRSQEYMTGILGVVALAVIGSVVLVGAALVLTAALAALLLAGHHVVAGLWLDRTLELVIVAVVVTLPAYGLAVGYLCLAGHTAWGVIVDEIAPLEDVPS